jgi:formylglycine-generating enzyme required for sulfatase activity
MPHELVHRRLSEGCGSQGDNKPAPVGTFAPNMFGLYDMVGNIWEWTEDCWHTNYDGAPPTDGSPWLEGANCIFRVDRGGSWGYPDSPRSALRDRDATGNKDAIVGFRVARTLSP